MVSYKQLWIEAQEKIENLEKEIEEIKQIPEFETDYACPKCGRRIIRLGNFEYYCSNKSCSFDKVVTDEYFVNYFGLEEYEEDKVRDCLDLANEIDEKIHEDEYDNHPEITVFVNQFYFKVFCDEVGVIAYADFEEKNLVIAIDPTFEGLFQYNSLENLILVTNIVKKNLIEKGYSFEIAKKFMELNEIETDTNYKIRMKYSMEE